MICCFLKPRVSFIVFRGLLASALSSLAVIESSALLISPASKLTTGGPVEELTKMVVSQKLSSNKARIALEKLIMTYIYSDFWVQSMKKCSCFSCSYIRTTIFVSSSTRPVFVHPFPINNLLTVSSPSSAAITIFPSVGPRLLSKISISPD